MSPHRPRDEAGADVKVDLTLRALGGESLASLAREAGRPRKQLSAWRRRFIAGGEAALDSGRDTAQIEVLRRSELELGEKVAGLERENRMLARRLELATVEPTVRLHPYCSAEYASGFAEPGVRPLEVAAWQSHVLVRERDGSAPASAVRPIGSLNPRCDVSAGIAELHEKGASTVALVTDPMWSPEPRVLTEAFDVCRPFKEHYLVDREGEVKLRKRHRNRINQARRIGKVREISLSEHLATWQDLYRGNVARLRIAEPFSESYFEALAKLPDLRALAVETQDELVAITLWVAHYDTLYFHDGASNELGMEVSAAYAAFAHAIETTDRRYVLLGGSAGLRDEPSSGLTMFKRGFANTVLVSYLCSARLSVTG
jgi:hypothetical protein